MSEHDEPIVVTDKRRLDPETGEVREASSTADTAVVEEAPAPQDSHLEDLQRLTAEYANYRKRVERERVAVVEMAAAGVLEGLLPLLDSVELARQHGDLDGPFKGVGEGLESLADKHGLERYGAAGDAFDPSVHDAVMQAPEDPTVTVPTVAQVLLPGWRLRSGRVLRHASVAVAEPGTPSEPVVQE